MRVLLDANVVLTYISGREDNYSESVEKIMKLCAEDKIEGYIAIHSLSIIWYVIRKFPDEKKREWLRQICGLLTVSGAPHEEIVAAVDKSDFKDFEDCLQDKCAMAANCDYIITANIKDYVHSEIKAISPDVFMALF